jgi:sporulation protein YlmC with PRC-barrel domain
MTLNDLLGCDVLTDDGTKLGHVIDIRLKTAGRDQPVQVLPFDALIVSRRRTGSLFGYERRREQGPALLAYFFRKIHRDTRLVPWSGVAQWTPGDRVVLKPGAAIRPALPG